MIRAAFVLVLCVVVASASYLQFNIHEHWYDASSTNYTLAVLPGIFIVNCSSSYIKCTAEPPPSTNTDALWKRLLFSKLNPQLWLEQHYERLRVTNGEVCKTSNIGHSIQALFSCRRRANEKDIWSPDVYDARDCSLQLSTSFFTNGLMFSIMLALILLPGVCAAVVFANFMRSTTIPWQHLLKITTVPALLFLANSFIVAAGVIACLVESNYDKNSECSEVIPQDEGLFILYFIPIYFIMGFVYLTSIIYLITRFHYLNQVQEQKKNESDSCELLVYDNSRSCTARQSELFCQ